MIINSKTLRISKPILQFLCEGVKEKELWPRPKIYPFFDLRRSIGSEAFQQSCRIVGDKEHVAVFLFHEAFGNSMIQKGQKRIEIPGNVDEPAWLLVETKLRPREDFCYFLKRAESAGQGDERIG